MSSQTYSVQITARDGTKSTFDAIKRGAEQDAAALQKMGQQGSAGLKQVDAAAKQTEGAFRNLEKASGNLKIGAAALGAAFTVAARSNLDQQRSIDALMRSYGTAGAEIVKFSNAIEDQSNFSDEAARSAAAFGATLVNQYGLSVEQVEQLLTRAADLAERTGTSFEDAAQRVTSAIRGEAESAEVFGIAAGDHALHLDQMAASTTDAERAQIRFAAVMEQSASAAGTAQRASEGTRGAVIDLAQSVGDAGQAIAEWSGPLGEAAAGLSDYALQTTIAVGGAVKLAQGLQQLIGVQRIAAVQSTALNLALGPAGIVAAGGLAVGALALLITSQRDADETAQAVTRAISDLNLELGNLSSSAATAATIGLRQNLAKGFEEVLTAAGEASDKLAEQKAEIDGIAYDMPEFRQASIDNFIKPLERAAISTENVGKATLAMSAILNYSGENWQAVARATADATSEWNNGRMSGEHYVETLVLIASSLGTLFKPIAQGATESVAGVKELESVIGDLSAVKLSPDLLKDIETIKTLGNAGAKEALKSYFDQFKRTGDIGAFSAQVDSVSDRVEMLAASEAKLVSLHAKVGDSASDAATGVGDLGHAFEITDEQIAAATAATLAHAEANNRWGPQIAAATEAQRLQREELDATVASINQYANALSGAQSFAAQLRPVDLAPKGGDKVTGTAADLQQTGSVLDSVLGTFKQLDTINQSASQAGTIAQNLIGDPGVIGEADRLLAKGRITTEEYNAAVDAGNDIRKESGAIENDLNTIRAKQLPLLAEADKRYGDVVDNISRMSAEEAQATLGFMDANEAMKAQNALSLVAAASMGELGKEGRKATQDILQGAVDADPVLREMLESIGLITTDPKTGTIKINFENGAEVKATLDDVVTSIDQLAIAIDLLDGKPDLDITVKYLADIEDAKKKDAEVNGLLGDTDGNSATVVVGGDNSGATGAIGEASGALGDLDGDSATVTIGADASGFWGTVGGIGGTVVGTAYIQLSAIAPPIAGMFAGGGIVAAAGGRMIGDAQRVRVNEGGIEMATLPTGDDVWLQPGTMVTPHAASTMGRGSGDALPKGFVNYGTLNVYANDPGQFYGALRSERIGASRA